MTKQTTRVWTASRDCRPRLPAPGSLGVMRDGISSIKIKIDVAYSSSKCLAARLSGCETLIAAALAIDFSSMFTGTFFSCLRISELATYKKGGRGWSAIGADQEQDGV